jgi:regulator of chromosome condensation
MPLFQKKIKKFACGDGYTLCLDDAGVVWSWGAGDCGQLGYEIFHYDERTLIVSATRCQRDPRQITHLSNKRIIDIACGKDFSFVVDDSYFAYSFGNNSHSQLAREKTVGIMPLPQIAEYLSNIRKIVCGWMHGMCLTKTGEVYIWGNPYYEYDNGFEDIDKPLNMELEGVIDISSGFNHFAAVSNKHGFNELYTWGMNEYVYLCNIGSTWL